MKICADTSFFGSLYLPDANASIALSKFEEDRQRQCAFPVNSLLILEVHNAIRLAVFRGFLAAADAEKTAETFDKDISAGLFRKAPLPADIWKIANELSRLHVAKMGCRSLDILQVAIALALRTDQFLTFDQRQRKLAVAAGLDAPDLMAPPAE